jgi:hypothetical protein
VRIAEETYFQGETVLTTNKTLILTPCNGKCSYINYSQ